MNISIQPSQLYSLIHQDVYIIDLRDAYQFSKQHIQNSINIPEEQLSFFIHLCSKNKPIYLICYSGEKAKEKCIELRNQGYQTFFIEGGFQGFLNQHQTSIYKDFY